MKNINALAFVLGCLVLGGCAIFATKLNKSFDRTVSVRGLCEREVKADKVIWPLAYKIGGDSLPAVYAKASAMNEQITRFLLAAGIKEDELSVASPKVEDNRAVSYSSGATFNYLITSVVTVCTGDVDKVLELQGRVGELIEAGIPVGTASSWEYPISFSFNGLNDIKPEMIEEATASAREAAQKFAKDSNSRLGKIRTASQGQFSIEDRDSNTPYYKKVRVVTSVVYYLN